MSMIGLLTGAPQATGGKAKTDDATAAGFGSTLQGAMDALAEAGKEQQGEAEAVTGDLSSLVELVDTPTGNPFANLSTTPMVEAAASDPLSALTGSATAPVLPVVAPGEPGTPDSPIPAPTSAESGTVLPASTVAPDGLAVGSDTPTASLVPATTGSAAIPVPSVATIPPAPPVEASTGNSVPASPNSSSAPVVLASTTAPALPVQARASSPVPASTSPASTNTATGAAQPAPTPPSAAPTGSPVQGANLPAGTVAQVSTAATLLAPLAESPTDGSVSASASSASAPASATGNASTSASPSAVAVPVSAPAQPVASAAQVSAPAPTASVPFTAQLARPIFSLAAAGAGEHVMTVSVTPDNLGPVTVRAHVGADGVRVELFAPNELGRDAIRAIIPELRRDLASAGLGGNLTLSSQNQPAADGSAHGSNAGQPGERGAESGTSPRGETAAAETSEPGREPTVDRTGLFGTTSTIDVLA